MRIAYLATADARGHLMRAQLLVKALRADGATVDVLTTSRDGVRFLAGFGIDAMLLSSHHAVEFDTRQNLLRGKTDGRVAAYLLRPSRMLRDIGRLRAALREHDLVVDDSFHPALLFLGCMPGWRRRVVHVYGASLREALERNFHGRLWGWAARGFERIVGLQIDASRARLAHDFAFAETACRVGNSLRLPTPVEVVDVEAAEAGHDGGGRAAVYLNPHFRDPVLAEALERGLAGAGLAAHCVGEGYAARPGWLAQDTHWVARAAHSDVIVAAPGMAALSVALVYRRPIVLVLTDQPEQRINALRAAETGLPHRTVHWDGDAARFAAALDAACRSLRAEAPAAAALGLGRAAAAARLQAWVSAINGLAV